MEERRARERAEQIQRMAGRLEAIWLAAPHLTFTRVVDQIIREGCWPNDNVDTVTDREAEGAMLQWAARRGVDA